MPFLSLFAHIFPFIIEFPFLLHRGTLKVELSFSYATLDFAQKCHVFQMVEILLLDSLYYRIYNKLRDETENAWQVRGETGQIFKQLIIGFFSKISKRRFHAYDSIKIQCGHCLKGFRCISQLSLIKFDMRVVAFAFLISLIIIADQPFFSGPSSCFL